MAKRSRDASFSPSDGDMTPPLLVAGTLTDDLGSSRPAKMAAALATPQVQQEVIQCSLPPHRDAIKFTTINAFELHCSKEHSNRCSSCNKNFPSEHFLMLHIDENHNPLREELQAKGERTYACFVEGCERICSTPQKRRRHLIDKHSFPQLYDFQIINTGVDKSISMLKDTSTRRRRLSTTSKHLDQLHHGLLGNALSAEALDSRIQVQEDVVGRKRSPDNLTTGQQSQSTISDGHKSIVLNFTENQSMASLQESMSALRFVPHPVAHRQLKKAPK